MISQIGTLSEININDNTVKLGTSPITIRKESNAPTLYWKNEVLTDFLPSEKIIFATHCPNIIEDAMDHSGCVRISDNFFLKLNTIIITINGRKINTNSQDA